MKKFTKRIFFLNSRNFFSIKNCFGGQQKYVKIKYGWYEYYYCYRNSCFNYYTFKEKIFRKLDIHRKLRGEVEGSSSEQKLNSKRRQFILDHVTVFVLFFFYFIIQGGTHYISLRALINFRICTRFYKFTPISV